MLLSRVLNVLSKDSVVHVNILRIFLSGLFKKRPPKKSHN